MSDTEIFTRLKATLHLVVKSANLENIRPETRLQEELDIDSIRLVDLVLNLEDEFGIQIDDGAIEGIKTVDDVTGVIKSRIG